MNFFKKYIYCKFSFIIIIYLFIVITSAGCGIKPLVSQEETTQQDVILGAGDVINIKFFNTPELDEIQTVRPDGEIALKLIGEVDVEGKTPSELQSNIIELYSNQLKNPEITVIVESLYSSRVYVTGEVNTPGVIDFPGRLTALEAIIQSGGFNVNTAKSNEVSVLRYKNGRRFRYQLNLKRVLKGKDEEPFFLKPFDIVYVPQNTGTIVNRWIEVMLPRALFGSYVTYIIIREFLLD